MNILVNCSNLKIGGGLQVAHSFINELQNYTDDKFIIVISKELKEQIGSDVFNEHIIFHYFDIKASPMASFYSKNKFLDKLVSDNHVNKVFTVFGPSYWRPKVPHICGYAKPQYIYKDSPFFNNMSLKDRLLLKLKELFHLHDFKWHNQALVTENEDVSIKIGKKLNKKVFTVTNNYNQLFEYPNAWHEKQLPFFKGKYLLTISSNYPHKNLNIIPKVVEELLKRDIQHYKFVLTLDKGDLKSAKHLDKYIEYIGKVDIKECPSLYQQCDYMFLPTLLECFSASYAEAMFMKKIILTSNLGFAKGICGAAAVYFDPLSPRNIVDKLLQIEQDSILKQKLIIEGQRQLLSFDTAQIRAEKYIKLIKTL